MKYKQAFQQHLAVDKTKQEGGRLGLEERNGREGI
jgi:hypothetical protein